MLRTRSAATGAWLTVITGVMLAQSPAARQTLGAGSTSESGLQRGERHVYRVPLEAGHRFGKLFGRQPSAVAIGDGAPRGDEVDMRYRLSRGRRRPKNEQACQKDAGSDHCLVLPLYTSASQRLSSPAACSGVAP